MSFREVFENDDEEELARAIEYSMNSEPFVTKPKSRTSKDKSESSSSATKRRQPSRPVAKLKSPESPKLSKSPDRLIPMIRQPDHNDVDDELAAAIAASLAVRSRSPSPVMEFPDDPVDRLVASRRSILDIMADLEDKYQDLMLAFTLEAAIKREGIVVDNDRLQSLNSQIESKLENIDLLRRNITSLLTSSVEQKRPISPVRQVSPVSPVRPVNSINTGRVVQHGNKLVFINEDEPVKVGESSSPANIVVVFHLPNDEVEERVLGVDDALAPLVNEFSRIAKDRLVIDRSDVGPFKVKDRTVNDVTLPGMNRTNVYLVSRLSKFRSIA